ncbi:MAG: hypothetical protein AAGA48_36545 [Myxococcota bacterium]
MFVAGWASVALAGPWGPVEPYAVPVVNVSFVSVEGNTFAQAEGGVMGGVTARYLKGPRWRSDSRLRVVGIAGLPSFSLGGDLRLGSFVGPDPKWVRWQVGPDLWVNGYGGPESPDYNLPWSPGLDLKNVLTLKFGRPLNLVFEATPGWALVQARQQGGVGPFHELALSALLVLRTPGYSLIVGYTRRYQTFGVFEGLIFQAGI